MLDFTSSSTTFVTIGYPKRVWMIEAQYEAVVEDRQQYDSASDTSEKRNATAVRVAIWVIVGVLDDVLLMLWLMVSLRLMAN